MEKIESDYNNFQIGHVLGLIQLVVGAVILLTGILGVFTAACRNTGINCLFAIPFCLMSLICMITLLILAFIASGAEGMIIQAKDEACASPLDGGETMESMIKTQYTKLVDRNMCSPFCDCPLDTETTWTSIPEKTLREYGRIASWDQATEEE